MSSVHIRNGKTWVFNDVMLCTTWSDSLKKPDQSDTPTGGTRRSLESGSLLENISSRVQPVHVSEMSWLRIVAPESWDSGSCNLTILMPKKWQVSPAGSRWDELCRRLRLTSETCLQAILRCSWKVSQFVLNADLTPDRLLICDISSHAHFFPFLQLFVSALIILQTWLVRLLSLNFLILIFFD